MKLPISVFIITKNEEKHLAKTLASVQDMDEIILVDSGSTDKTLEIAKAYGASIHHHDWMGYAKQKQYAMSLCKHEWVLNLDGDEAINPELVAAFRDIMAQDKADSVRFWRNDIFIGKPLSRFSKKANNHRFYKKSKSHFDDSRMAHESASVDGKEIFINHAFDHYGYDSISAITTKNNTYSTLKANEKFVKGKRYSLAKLLLVFPLVFLKEYLLQRKIFSGKRGFILSVMEAYYAFLKEAKLYEFHENNKP
ncbi:glycosyltransferase family 2 protein [Shewanella sp. JM162201]|uniref:Glycosyltransferase family 2 protein n=1 Tax=Shewanella jiangmenensis TaxID=2837387 RepID=A0ABS5V841_9GAMM|nr:glycosyltransferase family 2 protein [Shewanella jiangmenensis]MBT1446138.1 glycosyltransferase family 2 protein [Shewanella jiangmenensis]